MNFYEKENVIKSDNTGIPFIHYRNESVIKPDETGTHFINCYGNARNGYRVHNKTTTVEEVVPRVFHRRTYGRPKYPSHVNSSRENEIQRNENTAYHDASTNVHPTSPMAKTGGLNELVFGSFEQKNDSSTKPYLTADGTTVFDKKINHTNNHKISDEPYISENAVKGKIADSNFTRSTEFQFMDRSSPDGTSVIDIPKTRDRVGSKYYELKVPLEDSSTNRTEPSPTSVNCKPQESYVHVVNKLLQTYLPPPKPIIPFYSAHKFVERKDIPTKDYFSHLPLNRMDVKERRKVIKEFPGSTPGEVLDQLARDKISNNIPCGDEENRINSTDNHQVLYKSEEHELGNTTTHRTRKYAAESADITTSKSDSRNPALNYENSLSLNSVGGKNKLNFAEIDTHVVRELDGLRSDKKGTENNRIETENDSITMKSLSSLRIEEQSDGATYSYSTKAEDSHLFVDKTSPIVQKTISKSHTLNNIKDMNCIPWDIQSKPPSTIQIQTKPDYTVGRKVHLNERNQNVHSYNHVDGDLHRRGKPSSTGCPNQCHQCKKNSPPQKQHFAHPRSTYEDLQYNGRLSHLRTPSTQRPIQDHSKYSGASAWVDEIYHTRNYNHQNEKLKEGSRSYATDTPLRTLDHSSHVQARVPYHNNNFYPLRYSSGKAHPQMVMPESSSQLPLGSPRSAAPMQYPPPPSYNTPPYPEITWMDPSKRDNFVPDRYDTSPPKYNPRFAPVEAYHERQGFAHSTFQNQRQNPQEIKHVFTGWAGYNWPTIQKPEPTDTKNEEENMPVYTKPSVRRNLFVNDEIKKAMKKYTARLKKDLKKNKILGAHASNPGTDLDRPTLNSNLPENK